MVEFSESNDLWTVDALWAIESAVDTSGQPGARVDKVS